MLSKCQLAMATGGTVAQDLTMPWSTLSGFMQDLTLMVIDEGQQYGTDREIATISLLKQQPLILWTGDAQQTPGGIARTAPNAKRSRQLLLAKKHGLRSDRNYYVPSNLAEAMIRLLDDSSNEGLHLLNLFFCPSPLPFGGSTVLRLTRGPAGNRTTTGSLSAPSRTTPYQLSHEDTWPAPAEPNVTEQRTCLG